MVSNACYLCRTTRTLQSAAIWEFQPRTNKTKHKIKENTKITKSRKWLKHPLPSCCPLPQTICSEPLQLLYRCHNMSESLFTNQSTIWILMWLHSKQIQLVWEKWMSGHNTTYWLKWNSIGCQVWREKVVRWCEEWKLLLYYQFNLLNYN